MQGAAAGTSRGSGRQAYSRRRCGLGAEIRLQGVTLKLKNVSLTKWKHVVRNRKVKLRNFIHVNTTLTKEEKDQRSVHHCETTVNQTSINTHIQYLPVVKNPFH